jgi:alpha-beta hydrolase superfamily lysophospholipase
MHKLIIPLIMSILLLGIILHTGCITSNNEITPPTQSEEDIAKGLIMHFDNGTINEIYDSYFTETVKTQATIEQLEFIWTQIITQYGNFIAISGTRTTQEQGYTIVYVTCTYDKLGALDTRVVFDANKLIAGFQFVPTDLSYQYLPPSYANPTNFTEYNVTVGEGTDWPLPGTLTLPKGDGPFPAVVLVQGSGPNDRDETVGPNKPFKDLAWGLATNGIAVLRYEKRTRYYSDIIVTMLNNFTVNEETTDDALEAIKLLQATDSINTSQIYLLGHSLGAMMAPRIASKTAALAGVIMLAAPARHLEDLLLNQTIYLSGLDGTITETEQAQINSTRENVSKIKALDFKENEIIFGAGVAYWRDLQSYNPVATALNLTIPLLIMQGQRDYQVTYEEDYASWIEHLSGHPQVQFRSYETLNHLFLAGSGPPNNQEYYTPGNVAEDVVTDISSWIHER